MIRPVSWGMLRKGPIRIRRATLRTPPIGKVLSNWAVAIIGADFMKRNLFHLKECSVVLNVTLAIFS